MTRVEKYIIFIMFCGCFLESYAQDVDWKSYFVTPEMFGCKSDDIAAADSNAKGLQEAINYAGIHGVTLISSAGKVYYIGKGIVVSDFINIDLGRATLVATKSMRMLTVRSGRPGQWAGCIRNFRLDMNNQAEYGIYCENAMKLRFTDGEIVNIGQNAIGLCMMKGYELFIDNIHFNGSQVQSTGIMMRTSDCHISDCVMINCHTAVDNRGSNFYCRIHAWMTSKYLKGSVFFRTKGGPVYLLQCFGDTFDLIFDIVDVSKLHISQFRLFHNVVMWKKPYDDIAPELFHYASQAVADKSKIKLIDSNIGGLIIKNKNYQRRSNVVDKVEVIGTEFFGDL
ncbi:hypothetical protein [uncultured Bacteroides sp.]|uniref:hypothetical protein n=1 Tax=uncultured Bacteroides sp. TaxID=162156 RepID=UPI00261521B0|nr:hypothetical protein [uncultured Bacteroides sp.]